MLTGVRHSDVRESVREPVLCCRTCQVYVGSGIGRGLLRLIAMVMADTGVISTAPYDAFAVSFALFVSPLFDLIPS